ncbi:hypothetical protein [Sideroxydans sp. CL21]|nr:hypothetical protein [Sideroxydans sp. CL21]
MIQCNTALLESAGVASHPARRKLRATGAAFYQAVPVVICAIKPNRVDRHDYEYLSCAICGISHMPN